MKDLTEAATFDTPITVPEGDDSMDHLAEDLESFVQKLANRTAFLKLITDHAAQTNASNDFTVPQKSAVAQCDQAEWQCDLTAMDQPGNTSNKWKKRITMMALANARFGIFTGNDQSSEGKIAITFNATWHLAEQKWRQENHAYSSAALMFDGIDFWHFYSMPEGTTTDWNSWGEGSVKANDFVASNTISGLAGVFSGADVIALNDYKYLVPPSRTRRAALSDAFGYTQRDITTGNVHFIATGLSTDNNEIGVPLRLPTGSTLTQITVRHNLATISADTFTLRRRSGAIDSIAYTDLVHHDSATGVGNKSTSFDSISYDVNADDEYILVWKLNSIADPAAVSGNALIGIDYTFTDPGPRNF